MVQVKETAAGKVISSVAHETALSARRGAMTLAELGIDLNERESGWRSTKVIEFQPVLKKVSRRRTSSKSS